MPGKIANFCSFYLKLGHICTILNMECMEWRPYSAYRKMNFTQNFDNGHKRGLIHRFSRRLPENFVDKFCSKWVHNKFENVRKLS